MKYRRALAARAAIGVLGRLPEGEALPSLERALGSDDAEIAAAATSALGTVGGDRAEHALVVALDSDAPAIQTSAIRALGRIGSAAAVEPLRRLSERYRFRGTARDAIIEIQSRLVGARPGQLALADGHAGHLSLTERSPEGRVSIPDEGVSEGTIHWPIDARNEPSSEGASGSPPAVSGPSSGAPPRRAGDPEKG